LWPVVRDTLRQLEHALSPATFNPQLAELSFTLGMADATAAEILPRMERILQAEAPAVSLQIVPLTTRDPRRLLEDESIDLAVGYFPAVMTDLTSRTQGGEALP